MFHSLFLLTTILEFMIMKILKLGLITMLTAAWIAPLSACTNEKVATKTVAETEMSKEQLNSETNQQTQSKQSAEEVRALQKKLSEEGYYNGPIDGVMTPELRNAAKGALRDRV